MAKRSVESNWSKVKNFAIGVLIGLGILGGVSSLYTGWSLYVQNTGITRTDNGKKLNRAQLLDLLIVQAIQKGPTK